MNFHIGVALLLSQFLVIMGEHSTTLSWNSGPPKLSNETGAIVTNEIPVESVTLSSDIGEISTQTIEEVYTPDTDIFETTTWYDEWPDDWKIEENFPFYSKLEDRHDLLERLMLNYNKHILPYSGQSKFEISLNISLIAVGEIDELEEKMSTVLRISYEASKCHFK